MTRPLELLLLAPDLPVEVLERALAEFGFGEGQRHELVVHGPPGAQCRLKRALLAQARAIGSRNSARNVTTSESFAGHSVFGSLFRNAVHCASVDACSVKSGVNAIGATSKAVSRLANVAATAFASSAPSKVN